MDLEAYSGFNELVEELQDYISNVQDPTVILEKGAKSFVNDLLKLTKPYSQIRKSTYTHLISTFTYRKRNNQIEVGWGKYYGPMVEDGTKKMREQAHLYPLWQRNKEKYFNQMIKETNK